MDKVKFSWVYSYILILCYLQFDKVRQFSLTSGIESRLSKIASSSRYLHVRSSSFLLLCVVRLKHLVVAFSGTLVLNTSIL